MIKAFGKDKCSACGKTGDLMRILVPSFVFQNKRFGKKETAINLCLSCRDKYGIVESGGIVRFKEKADRDDGREQFKRDLKHLLEENEGKK